MEKATPAPCAPSRSVESSVMILFPFTGQPLLGDHLVDGADIGVHARFDYVHGNAAAGECFAVLLEADGRFAKRVFAAVTARME